MITEKKNRLSPLLKYPGGKKGELTKILPYIPADSQDYYEPFLGGGAVFFAIDAEKKYANDKSGELIDLYLMIKSQNQDFYNKLEIIDKDWELVKKIANNHKKLLLKLYSDFYEDKITIRELEESIKKFVYNNEDDFNGLMRDDFNADIENFVRQFVKSTKNKFVRIKKNEIKQGKMSSEDLILNIQCAFSSAFYIHFRYLYNNIENLKICKPFGTAIYFFIREYCYSSMFRYNSRDEFNVPFGGISYLKKEMKRKINYFKSDELLIHLKNTTFENLDFKIFLDKYKPKEKDFIFLDPPYDTEFSTYARNIFDQTDQKRLASYLINECKAYFMVVIKDTKCIRKIYPEGIMTAAGRNLVLNSFNKYYTVGFGDKKNKDVKHLIITNY